MEENLKTNWVSHSEIPPAAWSRKLNQPFPDHKEFSVSFLQVLKLLPLAFRVLFFARVILNRLDLLTFRMKENRDGEPRLII
jgi:hypothetical protein